MDRLNYALCTDASINVTVLNALELLDRPSKVTVACGKSRSGFPAFVTSTVLSEPFEPTEHVSLIWPDTLENVSDRRQHIVGCDLNGQSNNPADVFTDTQPVQDTSAPMNLKSASNIQMSNSINLAFRDSDDEGKIDGPSTEQIDINLVRLQNRPPRKWTREADSAAQELLLPDAIDVPVFPIISDTQASSFRPSTIEKFIHNAVAHP